MCIDHDPMYRLTQLTESNRMDVQHLLNRRFDDTYWNAIDSAVKAADLQHSRVLESEEGTCVGGILVCPPTHASRKVYKQRAPGIRFPPLEIAFVATDPAVEGRGWGRHMMSEVLLSCQTTQQGCWLHVDLDNVRAHGLYASFGFEDACVIPDPNGSLGTLMVWRFPHGPSRENTCGQVRPTLLNTRPCEAEESLCRRIFSPPGVTCS